MLSYHGTMIIVSLAILWIQDHNYCTSEQGSSRSSIYYFVAASAIQLVMSYVTIIYKKESEFKDSFIKVSTIIVVVIYGYLLVYFFLFKGCEELIKFWVAGNLLIIVIFVAIRYAYIILFHGKMGLKQAILKSHMNMSQDMINQSASHIETFKLEEDFYSISFFSYIYIDN